jgi:hypothetical protein
MDIAQESGSVSWNVLHCCMKNRRSLSYRIGEVVRLGVDCKSGFLDFVYRLYFNKITTFRKLDLLPSSGKK